MKRTALFAAALSAMAFAAFAQTSTPATSPAPAAATATATAIGPNAVDKSVTKGDPADRNCLKETGSRITPVSDRKGRKCVNATGRTYDRKDIDQTGATDLKDALRRLDPAVH